jgi:hypothetical protein
MSVTEPVPSPLTSLLTDDAMLYRNLPARLARAGHPKPGWSNDRFHDAT